MPLDYTKDRKYIVYATFNNQTINSGYFSFTNTSTREIFKKEIYSSLAFMIYQNRLARGAYSDRERLLWVETRNYEHGKNYALANAIGVLSTLTIFLVIDLIIWFFVIAKHILKSHPNKTKKL
jgi:hypothetical protein